MRAIGIDPGKHTGIAIFENGSLTKLYESDFWGCIDAINEKECFVIVELSTTKHVWHNKATSKGAIQRTGVNVGSCLREAELIVEYLIKNNINYQTQRPKGKVNSDMFKKITGWTKRTNQHTRDAALLVYGIKNT